MNKFNQLDKKEKTMFIELAGRGAKAASGAISKIVNSNVELEIRDISYLELDSIGEKILDSETVVTTLYLKITGDVAGSILLIFPNECAHFLVELLSQGKEKDQNKKSLFSDYERSILKEVSNIISGAFLRSLSDYLDLTLVESIPDMTMDMMQATVDSVLIDFSRSSQNTITVNIAIASDEQKITGQFFLLFDSSSADVVVEALIKKLEKHN